MPNFQYIERAHFQQAAYTALVPFMGETVRWYILRTYVRGPLGKQKRRVRGPGAWRAMTQHGRTREAATLAELDAWFATRDAQGFN